MSDDSQFDSGDAVKNKEENSLSLHELAAENDVQQLIRKLQSSISGLGVVAAVNQKNDKGQTPLHFAAKNNVGSSHYELTEILMKNGADPNAKERNGGTPLSCLVRNCNLEILKLFLKFKADCTNEGLCESSLLESATKNSDNLEVMKFLVEDVGLDVNHRDKVGSTPLHEAAWNNKSDSHYEILKYLLEKGADVNACDYYFDLTPLHQLVERGGNWRVVELFLKHNANVHAVSDEGRNILFACYKNDCDVQVINKLINDFGLDVNHLDKHKKTPLHFFSSSSSSELMNTKVVKCLLKNGADINVPDENGVTPLIEIMRIIDEDSNEWFLEKLNFFQFLIDQGDYSIVHNNVQMLDKYEKYQEDLDHPEFVWRWIVEHLAKLKFINISIHPIVLEFIERHADHKDYFTKCIEELVVMKNTKPQNSWINFFHLLVESRRKLKNYAGSEDLIQDYEYNDWLKIFPIYGALLKKNVEKGLRRRKLFDESSILLSDCLPIFTFTHLVVKDILDCISSKKDLSKFCK